MSEYIERKKGEKERKDRGRREREEDYVYSTMYYKEGKKWF